MPTFSIQSIGIIEISDYFPDIGTGIVLFLFLKVHIPSYNSDTR